MTDQPRRLRLGSPEMMDPEDRLELISLLANDEAWKAVVLIGRALLDHYYPADIFVEEPSGSIGPQYVVNLRKLLDEIEARQ